MLFLSTVSLYAGTTGSIMGFALDQDTGVPIEDVRVTIAEIGFSTGTDATGLFIFAGVQVGTYSLLVEKLGYQPVTVEELIVSLDLTTTISVELKSSPVEIKTPIIVRAARTLINRAQTGAVTKIDHNQIVDMSSRDIFRAAQITPGAVTNEDGQIKIRGTRQGNTIFLMDGLSIMDPFHNTFGAVVSVKGIMGEIAVVTGQFDAEYGNALGGVVNTVSRNPETKKYKGEFAMDTANALPDIFGDVERYRKLGEEEYNFSLEGPIPFIPGNKLGFLFAGQIFLADSSTSSGFQNEDYEAFYEYHLKLDYKISPTDRLQFHSEYGYAWIRLKYRYEAAGYTGWPIHHQNNRFHHLIYNRTISNDTFFKLALSWFHSGIDFGSHLIDTATGEPSYYEVEPLEQMGTGDYPAHQRSRHSSTEIRFDLNSNAFKDHSMKIGFDVQRIHTDLLWTVSLYDPAYIDMLGWDYMFPQYFYLENWIHEYYQTNGFVQDSWAVTDAILVNYGLRFDQWGYLEKESIKFQPRMGISYQLSDATVFRATASIKYQAPPVGAVYEQDSGYTWIYGVPYDWGSPEIVPEGSKDIEAGLQHAFGDDYVLDLSVYKKWLDDVVSTQYDPEIEKEVYSNIAEAHIEGLELTFRKTFSKFFEGWVTYTLMEAQGTNMAYDWYESWTTTDDNYNVEYYLDYDQRHTANINLTFKTEWAFVNFIWRYGSGYPFTPHDTYEDVGRDGQGPSDAGYLGPDTDGSEGDGVYQEGEPTSATDAASVWNSERYPAYSRADLKVRFRLPINWFGAQYWMNLTCRNLFDHFNLRGAGGNNAGDINPYTGEKWSYATGGTSRRYTWGIELKF